MIIFEITIGIVLSILVLIFLPFIIITPIIGFTGLITKINLYKNKKYLKKNTIWFESINSNPYEKVPYCKILDIKKANGATWVKYAKYNKNNKYIAEGHAPAIEFCLLYKFKKINKIK